jgi:hypothetical protein
MSLKTVSSRLRKTDSGLQIRFSDFGLLSAFGFRISDFDPQSFARLWI